MEFLHDCYVNWVDGGSRRHEIPEYFEWKDGDITELYDDLPLVSVTPKLFTVLEDGYEVIPSELLKAIYRLAYKMNPETKRRNRVDYCFAASDGERVIVINTEGDDKPNLKSRMVPKNEDIAFDLLGRAFPVYDFDGELDEEVYEINDSLEEYLLATNPKDYVGLTRVEREMKQIILDSLYNISLSDSKSEIFYWFVELFPDLNYPVTLAAMTNTTMIQEMFSYLRKGFSQAHIEWGTQAVKIAPNDVYKDDWKNLVKESKRKDKVPN